MPTPNKFPQWIEPGILITLLLSMFYTAGWSFACHYFDHFHMGLIELDIPREYLLMYSFWAVKAHIFQFVLLLLLVGHSLFSSLVCNLEENTDPYGVQPYPNGNMGQYVPDRRALPDGLCSFADVLAVLPVWGPGCWYDL